MKRVWDAVGVAGFDGLKMSRDEMDLLRPICHRIMVSVGGFLGAGPPFCRHLALREGPSYSKWSIRTTNTIRSGKGRISIATSHKDISGGLQVGAQAIQNTESWSILRCYMLLDVRYMVLLTIQISRAAYL